MPKIEKLHVEKSVTVQKDDKTWIKNCYGLEVDVTDLDNEQQLETSKDGLSKKLSDWLEQEQLLVKPEKSIARSTRDEIEHAPFDFNPEELMQHEWKGKKIGEGTLAWGWDFAGQFSENVIRALQKEPLIIDGYRFTLAESGNIVSAHKVKA